DPLPGRLSYERARAMSAGRAPGTPLHALAAGGGHHHDDLHVGLDQFPRFAGPGAQLSRRSSGLEGPSETPLASGATGLVVVAPVEVRVEKGEGRAGVLAVFAGSAPGQQALADLLDSTSGPVAVLVDDAEALHGTPVGDVLGQIPVQGRSRGHALVIAGTTGELIRLSRGFTAAARQFRCGLLLTPEAATLGQELFSTRLPRSATFDRPPGRGYLIRAGQAILAQVPEPPPS